MEDKHIVTIDLGTDKLGISVATIDSDRKVSLNYYNEFASDGIKHSRVSNPSRLSVSLKKAFTVVEKAMRIRISEVMVNVQRYGIRELDCRITSSTGNGTNVSDSDLEMMDNTVWESRENLAPDEEIVACVAQSYDLDAGEINVAPDEVVGMCSENITGKYKVYAVKQNSINVIDNAFRDSGVINVRKVFVPDYTGRGMLSDNEIQGGVALVDLGAGASSVSVFSGGVLRHYGAIPFGGKNITSDIANVCCISEKLAENIKMAFGGCMPDRLGTLGEKKLRITDNLDKSRKEVSVKYLSEIITARQREIVEALLYEIQLSGYADKLKNGVIVTGGGASMLNICHFIKEISGYNTKVGAASRDRFESEVGTFFSLGASMSGGLLRKYAVTETLGCECLEHTDSQPASGQELSGQTAGQRQQSAARQQETESARTEDAGAGHKKPEPAGHGEAGHGQLFDDEDTGSQSPYQPYGGKQRKSNKLSFWGRIIGPTYDEAMEERKKMDEAAKRKAAREARIQEQEKYKEQEKHWGLLDFGEDEDV